MKILIADDASAKIGVIKNTLKELPIYESLHIDQVLDLNGAKEKMVAEFYDLLILDLNMPLEIGEAPDMKAGAEFVDEIIDTNSIKKPIDIIVLSAFDSSVQEFKKQVERTGFLIIPYDENVLSWRETLKSRVSYLQLLREQRSYIPKPPHCDILLVTAVSVETNAVINLAPTWRSFQIDGDSTVYRKTVVEAKGKHFSVIHAQLPEMGMTAASTHTAKAVLHFKPQYVIMSGIAGGLEKDANIGDILVATDVWNYNSGKYVDTMGGKSSTPELCPDSTVRNGGRGPGNDDLSLPSADASLLLYPLYPREERVSLWYSTVDWVCSCIFYRCHFQWCYIQFLANSLVVGSGNWCVGITAHSKAQGVDLMDRVRCLPGPILF